MRFLLPFILLLFLAPSINAHPWDDAEPTDVTFHLVTADPGHHLGAAWFGHSGLLAEVNGTTAYYAYRLHIVDSPFRAAITTFTDVDFSLHQRTWESKINEYTEQGRSMRTVELDLAPAEKEQLIAGIEAELARRDDPHTYRMIHDNCSTRLRDLLDGAIIGGLPGLDTPLGSTVRDIGPNYVEHDVIQANLLYLFMGPGVDQELTQGTELFLPLELESYMLDVGIGREPVDVLTFPYPEPGPGHGRVVAVAASLGLLAAAAIFGLATLHRRGDPTASKLLGYSLATGGLLAIGPATILALAWTDVLALHFHHNLNVLLLSPLVAAWVVVGPAWARGATWAPLAGRRISQIQLVLTGVSVLLHVLGVQVMDSSIALVAPIHAATWYAFTADAVPSGSEQPHPEDATLAQNAG